MFLASLREMLLNSIIEGLALVYLGIRRSNPFNPSNCRCCVCRFCSCGSCSSYFCSSSGCSCSWCSCLL